MGSSALGNWNQTGPTMRMNRTIKSRGKRLQSRKGRRGSSKVFFKSDKNDGYKSKKLLFEDLACFKPISCREKKWGNWGAGVAHTLSSNPPKERRR